VFVLTRPSLGTVPVWRTKIKIALTIRLVTEGLVECLYCVVGRTCRVKQPHSSTRAVVAQNMVFLRIDPTGSPNELWYPDLVVINLLVFLNHSPHSDAVAGPELIKQVISPSQG